MHNQTLLITGASGFLGTWLADAAYAAGYRIIGIDLRAPSKPQIWAGFATSACDTTDLPGLLQGESLYAVCHLAGGASVASSFSDPYGDFASLIPGTSRLALYLAKSQPQARLYLFSSAAVYGNPKTLPISERSRVRPISPYGIHKATSESLLFHYARVLKSNVTAFRIFSVFGPGLKKQIVWDVGQHALDAVHRGKTSITLFGTGAESRDFIYVKDLCKAVLTVLAHASSQPIEIYNLASGIECRISEVAACLVQKLGLPLGISFNGEGRKGDPLNWRADISKLKTLGFQPDYNLETGLKEVAVWMNKQAPAVTTIV
jgi:UDP-glucose 4-epimerase